jgi:peptidoglycan/xylan/chitin deacetylase (PgdA/CDA1 family)
LKRLYRWGVGPSILMYHSIAEDSQDPYTVTPKRFQDQVSWLLDHGFEPAPLASIVSQLKTGDWQTLKKKVVFTFDDGYQDFLTTALPILLRHKVPATVFIVTSMLGKKASWSGNGRHLHLMTEDEIRYIKTQDICLGSHTATHANLTLLDNDSLQRQLRDSHDELVRLGESFYPLSYPWAQWSNQVLHAVRVSNYQCAVAAGGKIQLTALDQYLLPRITVGCQMDIKRFKSILTRNGLEMEIRRRYCASLNTSILHRGIE